MHGMPLKCTPENDLNGKFHVMCVLLHFFKWREKQRNFHRRLWEPAAEFHRISTWTVPVGFTAPSAKRTCPQAAAEEEWGAGARALGLSPDSPIH